MNRQSWAFWVALISFVAISNCGLFQKKWDVVIVDGLVVDGTGRPAYRTNLALRDGIIAAMGVNSTAASTLRIDAGGLVVAPGFIDLHTHAERRLLEFPDAENYVWQGVTTLVGGNCGGSPWPIGAFLHKADSVRTAINLALLVGHNTIRREVMGLAARPAKAEELRAMERLVAQAMKEGAFGLSTGLKYVPGAYSTQEEVVALARVAAQYGGFYATHMRDEGLQVMKALEEALEIGYQADIPVHISHHKVMGRAMWGKSVETLRRLDRARHNGLDVTLDVYPYTATSTGLQVVFPAWALAGGQDSLLARLSHLPTRARIKKAVEHVLRYDRGGGDPASIVVARFRADSSLEGKNLAEITRLRGRTPTIENAAETLMELQAMGGGSGIYHALHEDDVRRIMEYPQTAIASDGGTLAFGEGMPHPRNYGTFPRVLARYVRENSVLTLEEAIYKMTGLPAARLGLKNRGVIQEGAVADIVIFDPQRIADRATWEKPHQYAEGVVHLLVHGEPVLLHEKRTGRRPGQVLRGPAWRR